MQCDGTLSDSISSRFLPPREVPRVELGAREGCPDFIEIVHVRKGGQILLLGSRENIDSRHPQIQR